MAKKIHIFILIILSSIQIVHCQSSAIKEGQNNVLTNIPIYKYEVDTDKTNINIDSTYIIDYCRGQYEDNAWITRNIEEYVYYRSGKLKKHYFLNKENQINGTFKSYYESGSLQSISNYINNRLVGNYYEYYPSGNIKIVGFYKNIECMNDIKYEYDTTYVPDINNPNQMDKDIVRNVKSIKDMSWSFYSKDGKIAKIEVWKDGKLIETKDEKKMKAKKH